MTTYTLTAPMIITSRLMPGAVVGDSTISVEPTMWDGAGYNVAYYIDGPDGAVYSAQDISVSLIAGETVERDLPRKALSTLLSFLLAEAESYRRTMGASAPEDGWLFDAATAEWAYMNDSEISGLACDLEGDDL